MIPILYEANEVDFITNGLGRLSDVIECNVVEERNGKYELSMKYPLTGVHFEDLEMQRIISAIPSDGKNPQPFSIYYISKPINGICEIKAEHISYRLSLIPVSPFSSTTVSGALLGIEENAEESCPFTFWTDKTTSAEFSVEQPSSARSLLGGRQGSILDVYGGEYEFDEFIVKLHNARGINRGVTLRYGKNITDIRQEENISSTYTGVMPFWKGTEDQTDVLVMLTEKVIHSSNASSFPYQRTIPLDLSSEFQNRPTEAQLRTRAQSYMNANKFGVPDVSIKVSFVALWQSEEYKNIANLERVNLCDTVQVYFPKLNITASAKVIQTDYNVLKERYNSIELGEAKSNFASTVKKDIQTSTSQVTANLPTKSYLQQAVDRATRLITGGLGGHVVFTLNADGEPQEILVMDTDDIQTAINVLRINQNGIGFSSNGYQGPFQSAWTIDGHFVADFIDTGNLNASLITTGTLDADLIQSGRIESNNGLVYFDLDNNELSCSKLVTPTPWPYTTSKDPGDPIIRIEKGMYGLTSNPNYYALIQMYKKGGENDGLFFYIPKPNDTSTSATDPRIFSTQSIRICSGVSNVYRDTDYGTGGEVEVWKNSYGGGFTITAKDTSGNHTGYIHCAPSGIMQIGAEGIEFYGSTNAYVSFGQAAISRGFKSRVMETEDYGERLLYCYEMPTPIFGDIGSGTIGEDGYAIISIDEIFDETTRVDLEYFVFLQAEGKGELYVEDKQRSYFIVKGTPNLNFAWEIKAKQKDAVVERFEPMPERQEESEYDFEGDYYKEIEDYFIEQEAILYETA